ncbi:MAG TPA: lytic transglycosylase domain-containing protein, partial [Spirochaetes bacterium]|nr:lytic transglycosylase domain-containing protein [Spirochaetota bacterium]
MITDMYGVMTRIAEIKKRFGLSGKAGMPQLNNFQQALEDNLKNTQQAGRKEAGPGEVAPVEKALGTDALRQMARETAISKGVPPGLVDAVISTESSYNPRAVSPKGAQGLMQLMPSVSSMMGVENPFSPGENLGAGVGLLKTLLDKYGWDYKKALAAYNAGEKAVDEHGGMPPYRETREYVRKVMD